MGEHIINVKGIRKRDGRIGAMFPAKYSFSPYRACGHACKYCDGRAEKYYIKGDFEKDIEVRENIAEILYKDLKKMDEKGFVSVSSGVSDAYQPIEKKKKIMSKCFDALNLYSQPSFVVTKSSLILRDIEKIDELNKKAGFVLMVSLTFADDKNRVIFEPGASSVEERLNLIKEFKSRGIGVGVLAMPFIPFVSDTDENIDTLFSKLKELDVDFVIPGELTLRPGRQKDTFMSVIDSYYLQYKEEMEKIYIEERQSGMPTKYYSNAFYEKISRYMKKYSFAPFFPHKLYKGKVAVYDEISLLLEHMCWMYEAGGVDISKLKIASENYFNWLELEKEKVKKDKRYLYRDIDRKIAKMLKNGSFNEIIDNEKLFGFLKKVVLENKIFDYANLKLL